MYININPLEDHKPSTTLPSNQQTTHLEIHLLLIFSSHHHHHHLLYTHGIFRSACLCAFLVHVRRRSLAGGAQGGGGGGDARGERTPTSELRPAGRQDDRPGDWIHLDGSSTCSHLCSSLTTTQFIVLTLARIWTRCCVANIWEKPS